MRTYFVGRTVVRSIWFRPDGRSLMLEVGTADRPRAVGVLHLDTGRVADPTPVDGAVALDSRRTLAAWQAQEPVADLFLEWVLYHRQGDDVERWPMTAAVFNLAVSPNDRELLVSVATLGSEPPTYKLARYDRATRQNRWSFPMGGQAVTIRFSPNHRLLAATDIEDGVRLWSWPDGQGRATWETEVVAARLAFSPDSQTLAGTQATAVALWDVLHDWKVRQLHGHTDTVTDVAYSPDGDTIATASLDGTVRLWDAATCAERLAYRWDMGRPHSLAYAPDGLTIAAGGDTGRVVLWDVDA